MADSPLVPNVGGLVQSLRQFTPQAKESRAFELAGLESQQALQQAQTQNLQQSAKKQQILNIANESRAEFLEERNDIKFVLKDGIAGLRNNISLLAQQKGEDHPDLAELVDFANKATTDPEGTFATLKKNAELVDSQISSIDEILGRTTALDQAKTAKFNAEAEALGGNAAIPLSLIKGLPKDMAKRVADAFSASGGGDKGMKAANEERVLVKEDISRSKAHESLAITYPNATPEEMGQLQAAIDRAPSVEKGMATAETVRTNQRAAQKAAVMSDRSLVLVNNILANSELADVIGSSEGKFGGTDQPTGALPFLGGFISDKEAEAIADIEEITNILTVPAMKIMTGILSESDLRLLKTISGGAFNRTRGIDRFKADVGQIQKILSRASIIGKLPPKDREAAMWATDKKNMNTPQSKQIRKKLGLQ